MDGHNQSTDDEPILVRLGAHVGDVIERDGDLFGETVNIAARLEPQAPPGQVCVSPAVFDQVAKKVNATATDLGERELKNMPAMQLWSLAPASAPLPRRRTSGFQAASAPPAPEQTSGRKLLAALVVCAAAIVATEIWTAQPGAGEAEDVPTEPEPPPIADRVLRFGQGGEWATFDLYSDIMSVSKNALELTTEPLLWGGRDGKPEPGAVDRWEIEQGGRKITLHLARDVTFHPHPCLPDGRPANGADVVASLALAADRLHVDFGEVEPFEGGVTLHRKLPSPFPLLDLSNVLLVPSELIGCDDPKNLKVIPGSGPYRMTGPLTGETLRLERASVRGGPFAAVELTASPMNSVATASDVAMGRMDLVLLWHPDKLIDGINTATPQMKPAFASAGVRTTPQVPSNMVNRLSIAFLGTDGPWANPDVRRALALGLDREALAPLHPGANKASGRLMESRWLGYDPALEELRHDPEGAAAALVRAGFPNGAGLPPLELGVKPVRMAYARAAAEQVAPLGIRIEFQEISQGSMASALDEANMDAMLSQRYDTVVGTDPYWVMTTQHWGGSEPTQQFTTLREAVLVELDRETRKRLYAQIEKELLAHLPGIPLAVSMDDTPSLFYFHRDDLTLPFLDPVTGYTENPAPTEWWREFGR